MKKIAMVLCLLVQALCVSIAFAAKPDQQTDTFPETLKKVMPAVVNITVQGSVTVPAYLLPPAQGGEPSEKRIKGKFEGAGSGVIVDAKKGYIVTNAHLLHEAKTIIVMLSDGRKLRARLVGLDKLTDLAVLQIKADKLTELPFANPNELQVGDFVAAIGNPFVLHHTVTSGIVSALNRSGIKPDKLAYQNFIQMDASINPGNSGGALVNRKGELVGINTALLGPIKGNVGISFAIPVYMVKPIMEQLIKHGKINRGVIGVFVQNFTPNLADAFDMSGVTGALLTEIKPGSAAEKAGLKVKDVVTQVNDTPIKNMSQFRATVALYPVGSTLDVKVRRGKETKHFKPVIAPLASVSPEQNIAAHPLKGVQLQNYDAFSVETSEMKGVEVTFVNDASDAWIAGLRPGDIILTASGKKVTNIKELLSQVKESGEKPLLLSVWRAGGILFIVVA